LSSNLPPEEKTDLRLASEAQLTVFAGEGTTGEIFPFVLITYSIVHQG
jgi:hypothetical protein